MLGKNCGQEAADKYCQIHGYQKATGFQIEKASPTQTLLGQRCTGSVCVAFKSITCFTTPGNLDRCRLGLNLLTECFDFFEAVLHRFKFDGGCA
jgi:hypothetical protein